MKNASLQPVAKVADIEKFESLRYLPGFPRNYRFDAKKGVLRFKNEAEITAKGQSFSFIPIAFRIFSDEILNFPPRKWAEMLFINGAGQVCAVLFHGYSVDRLQTMLGDLYYEEVNLCELILTVTPTPRSNEHGGYYVASFSYELLSGEEVKTMGSIINALPPLYREETLTGDATNFAWRNYHLPARPDLDGLPADCGELSAGEANTEETVVQEQGA